MFNLKEEIEKRQGDGVKSFFDIRRELVNRVVPIVEGTEFRGFQFVDAEGNIISNFTCQITVDEDGRHALLGVEDPNINKDLHVEMDIDMAFVGCDFPKVIDLAKLGG